MEKSDLRRVAIKPISGLGGDGKMHVDADGRTPLSEYVVGLNRYRIGRAGLEKGCQTAVRGRSTAVVLTRWGDHSTVRTCGAQLSGKILILLIST